jgi:hypothetical protein
MKKAVFWDVAPCRLLVPVHTVSSLADFLIFSFNPENGGDMFLRNVG